MLPALGLAPLLAAEDVLGISSHLCISIADEVRLLNIEVPKKFPPPLDGFVPVLVALLRLMEERLLLLALGCIMQGDITAGCSEARLDAGAGDVCSETHSEYLRLV